MIDICREANITMPTVCSHYPEINSILRDYEASMQQELQQFINRACDAAVANPKRSTLFTILLEFITKYRDYFRLMAKNQDRKVITCLIDSLKPMIFIRPVNDLEYNVYINTLISIIYHWIERERFSKALIPNLAKLLCQVRIMKMRGVREIGS